eukprot:2957490-Rhodomonas_salina.1
MQSCGNVDGLLDARGSELADLGLQGQLVLSGDFESRAEPGGRREIRGGRCDPCTGLRALRPAHVVRAQCQDRVMLQRCEGHRHNDHDNCDSGGDRGRGDGDSDFDDGVDDGEMMTM